MSKIEKYYYLKLKENFFDSEEMKMLESMDNGIEYQNLYLKLCLLSIKAEGMLAFKNLLPYDIKMLSTIIRVHIDTVRTGLGIFEKLGLLEKMGSGVMYMTDIQTLIGKSSTEGDRVKEYRMRITREKMSERRDVQMYDKSTE